MELLSLQTSPLSSFLSLRAAAEARSKRAASEQGRKRSAEEFRVGVRESTSERKEELGDLVTTWVELDRLVGGCCLRGGTDRCSLFSLGKTSRLVQAAHNLAWAAVTLMITGGAAPDRPAGRPAPRLRRAFPLLRLFPLADPRSPL